MSLQLDDVPVNVEDVSIKVAKEYLIVSQVLDQLCIQLVEAIGCL